MAEEKPKQKVMLDKAGQKKKRINLLVDPDKWERFQKIAKILDSDASKEVRKFVDKYISENKDLGIDYK